MDGLLLVHLLRREQRKSLSYSANQAVSPPSPNPAAPPASLPRSDEMGRILGRVAADTPALLPYTVALCHWHRAHPPAFRVLTHAVSCVS